MTVPVLQRKLQCALTACLAAAGLLSFVDLASAQAGAGGNPVDNLPTPQTPAASAGQAAGRILAAPTPAQPAVSRPVTPKGFDIEGVKSIPFEEVAGLFKPLINQPGTVAQLIELARQCTALYQKQGYALSFCYVPQQNFEGGTVRVVAVEGYIDTVKIDGDAGPGDARIREMAELIRKERPLTLETFDRYTQLMGQLPGMQVQASATPPASTDGKGSLLLKVSRKPYQVSVGTDFRSKRPRAVLTGVLNDPLTAGSSVSASTLLGGESGERFVSASASQQVGSEGLVLKAETSLYKGNPDAGLDVQPQIRRYNTYRRAELSASYPLKLTRTESLQLSGGGYAVRNTDDYSNPANGAQLTEEVNVRALFVQAGFVQRKEDQARNLTLRFVQGIKGLGADATISTNVAGISLVNPAKLDFSRVVLEGSQRDNWGDKFGTAVTFGTQYSPHVLPSTERVSFGSTRFGRAYRAGEIAGDSGWGLGLEVNRSFALGMDWIKQVQPFMLLEHARVYSRSGSLAFSKLESASLGFRLTDGVHYNLELAASKPLGDPSPYNPSRDVRLTALLTYSFGRD